MYIYNTDTSAEIKERLRQLNNTLTTEIQELETRLVENNITITELEIREIENNNTYNNYIKDLETELVTINNTYTTHVHLLETRLVENENTYTTKITELEIREVQNNNTYNNYITELETKLEDILIEVNNTFTAQISRLCQATCSRRAQNTVYATFMPIDQNDHPSQTTRCFECCKQLTQNACESLALDDNFPPPDCIWLPVGGDGGGCVSDPGVIGVLG